MKEGLGNLALQTVGKPDFFIPTICKNARHGDPHLLFQDWGLVDRILKGWLSSQHVLLGKPKVPEIDSAFKKVSGIREMTPKIDL